MTGSLPESGCAVGGLSSAGAESWWQNGSVSSINIMRISSGGTCGMSVETLINLSRLYGVSLDTLIYGEKEKKSAVSQEEQLMRGLNGMPQSIQDYCLRMLWLFADGLRAAQAEAAAKCETVPETVKSSSDSKKNSGGEA